MKLFQELRLPGHDYSKVQIADERKLQKFTEPGLFGGIQGCITSRNCRLSFIFNNSAAAEIRAHSSTKRKRIASDGESQSSTSRNQKAAEGKNKEKMCDSEDRRLHIECTQALNYDIGSSSTPPPPPPQNRGMPRTAAMGGVTEVISNSILEIKERLTDRECVWIVDYVLDDGNNKLNSLILAHLPAEVRIQKSRGSNDG